MLCVETKGIKKLLLRKKTDSDGESEKRITTTGHRIRNHIDALSGQLVHFIYFSQYLFLISQLLI